MHTDLDSNIYLKVKKAGGMKITFQTPPKNLDEKMIFNVLRDYKILNCEVLVRDENGTLTPPALCVFVQTAY
jgi:ribosome-interacting GTPase 1